GVGGRPPPPVDGIVVKKAVNAVDPLAPTTLEDGDTAPGQSLLVGTNLVFTYLVTNTGQTDLVNPVVMDDAGTPGIAGDDFVAVEELSCGVIIRVTDHHNTPDSRAAPLVPTASAG